MSTYYLQGHYIKNYAHSDNNSMYDRKKYKATQIEIILKEIITSENVRFKEYLFEHFSHHNSQKESLGDLIKANQESEYINFVIDDYINYDAFNQILFNSLLVSLYSHLEFWLNKLAKRAETLTNSKIKLADLNGNSDLERAKKYINIVGEIEFTNINDVWSEIKDYQVIRNLIVHNSSNLYKHHIVKKNQTDFSKQEKNAFRIIKSTERLEVKLETGSITIKDINYVWRLSSLNSQLLHYILDEIIKKYPK